MRTAARCTLAWAADAGLLLAQAALVEQGFKMAGVMRATTSPACTASPSRSAMRASRPAKGAEML